jgi:hypothetical protein
VKPILAALIGAALLLTAAGCSSDSRGSDTAESGDADGGGAVSAVCAPEVPDCEEMIVVDDGSQEGAPPSGVSLVDTATFDLTVAFDESVTQADQRLAEEVVREIDADADFVIQESFPPVGRASITTGDDEACAALTEELMNVHGVANVRCEPAQQGGTGDPDEPVSSSPGGASGSEGPVTSADGIAEDECSLVHNIDACSPEEIEQGFPDQPETGEKARGS